MINNVVFYEIRHFYSACSSRASPFPNSGTPLKEVIICYIDGEPIKKWRGSRSAGYYEIQKLIRCFFIHHGSIFQMHNPWPGGFLSFFSYTSVILSQCSKQLTEKSVWYWFKRLKKFNLFSSEKIFHSIHDLLERK